MSIAGYFGKTPGRTAVDRKDRSGVNETQKRYEGVAQYDPVLRSHCGLGAPPKTVILPLGPQNPLKTQDRPSQVPSEPEPSSPPEPG